MNRKKEIARIAPDVLLDMYRKMVQTRCFEETAAKLFTLGKVHGTAHFCIGEEAAGIGACVALDPADLIYATHRGHGQSIGKGMDINRMMAEFLGKATGFCKGKGGCMHIADLSRGNLGANGIVGGGIPIAVGAALTTHMKKIDRVVLCFFGDGACNEGSFHEALNLASIWRLPIIFYCVNNHYGMSMHLHEHMNIKDISQRATAYGIPGRAIDGNDIVEVYHTVRETIPFVKKNGPTLIVANTYRIMGHSKSDANVYRTREEIESWKARCPIKRMRAELLQYGIADEAALQTIEAEAAEDIRRAVEFAENSPDPSLETITDDVYAP